MENLEWTGERLTTGVESVHGVIEHLHRYALAQKITKNKIVLDIASGEGYGSFLISKNAQKVYGVDIDSNSINHSKKKYSASKNLEFIVGSTDNIPLTDNSVDVVISFETIEHHDKHDLMMKEIKRVLKKDGVLLISSPEKSIYKERDPDNIFHIKELTIVEFENLLKKYFNYSHFYNQRFVIGSLIHLVDTKIQSEFNLFDGNYTGIINDLKEENFYNKSYFNLAICSNELINVQQEIGYSLFNGVKVVIDESNAISTALKSANSQIEKILNSKSYRLGNFIFKRINFLRKIWKK